MTDKKQILDNLMEHAQNYRQAHYKRDNWTLLKSSTKTLSKWDSF